MTIGATTRTSFAWSASVLFSTTASLISHCCSGETPDCYYSFDHRFYPYFHTHGCYRYCVSCWNPFCCAKCWIFYRFGCRVSCGVAHLRSYGENDGEFHCRLRSVDLHTDVLMCEGEMWRAEGEGGANGNELSGESDSLAYGERKWKTKRDF